MMINTEVSRHDRQIIRDLAKRQMELASSPLNLERETLWYAHNSMRGSRPMVLIETDPFINDLVPRNSLECECENMRQLEQQIKLVLKHFAFAGDDKVVRPYHAVNWNIHKTSYGVEIGVVHGTDAKGGTLAHVYDYPIKNFAEDFGKLSHSEFSVDRNATMESEDLLNDLFGDILPVKRKGYMGWTMGLTWEAIKLIGLQNLMIYIYDEPDLLHQLMQFLLDDHLLFLDWMEREHLLTLNNENDYVGSGTYGFCHELPGRDIATGDGVKTSDLWALVESQESVGISPRNFEDFIFPYHMEMAKRFGMVYYGCCEPVHERWDMVKKLPHLRTVSISPWCDEAFMAEKLKDAYIYSRKPLPTLLSTDDYDEDIIRKDIQRTLSHTQSNHVELIMKDLHTVNGDLGRIKRWVDIVRAEIG